MEVFIASGKLRNFAKALTAIMRGAVTIMIVLEVRNAAVVVMTAAVVSTISIRGRSFAKYNLIAGLRELVTQDRVPTFIYINVKWVIAYQLIDSID